MLDLEDGVDAISGRKRAGAMTMAARMFALVLIGFLIVMTVYVLL